MDQADLVVMDAWDALNATVCKLCGRPKALHETQTFEDYMVGWDDCPATEALDRAQAEKAEEDRKEAEQGLNPDRSRVWDAWLPDERPDIA